MEPTLDSDTIETEKKCMRKCTRTLGLVEKVAINTSDKFILGATIVYVQNVKIEKCRKMCHLYYIVVIIVKIIVFKSLLLMWFLYKSQLCKNTQPKSVFY